MARLKLRILTSDTIKVDEEVDMVIMRCVTESVGNSSSVGEMGVLPGHIACSAVLGISPIRIKQDEGWRIIAVYGGLVRIKDDVVTVLTEKADWPDEIDEARARASMEEVEQRMREAMEEDTEIRTNQIALRRALVRVEVSSYPLIGRK